MAGGRKGAGAREVCRSGKTTDGVGTVQYGARKTQERRRPSNLEGSWTVCTMQPSPCAPQRPQGRRPTPYCGPSPPSTKGILYSSRSVSTACVRFHRFACKHQALADHDARRTTHERHSVRQARASASPEPSLAARSLRGRHSRPLTGRGRRGLGTDRYTCRRLRRGCCPPPRRSRSTPPCVGRRGRGRGRAVDLSKIQAAVMSSV